MLIATYTVMAAALVMSSSCYFKTLLSDVRESSVDVISDGDRLVRVFTIYAARDAQRKLDDTSK